MSLVNTNAAGVEVGMGGEFITEPGALAIGCQHLTRARDFCAKICYEAIFCAHESRRTRFSWEARHSAPIGTSALLVTPSLRSWNLPSSANTASLLPNARRRLFLWA